MSKTAIVEKAAPMPMPPVLPDPNQVTLLAPGFLAQAQTFLAQLGALSAALTPPVIDPNFPATPAAPNPITTSLPTLETWSWASISPPAAFSGTLDTNGLLPAPFTETPPAMSWGTAPAAFSGQEPELPPIDLNFTFPTLSYTLPSPPDLLSLQTVTAPTLNFPTFDAVAPTLTAIEPQVFQWGPETLYTSQELTLLKATLSDRISNGGTGLPPAVEEALWNRAREREYRQQADALADLDRMEAMGYALPPGVWLDARLKLQTETNNTMAGLSREIMIKQAELELENIIKAIEQLNMLEGKLIDYWNQYNQRAFEATKYLTQANIDVYNAKVKGFEALVEAYKSRVGVYEALIRAEIARVDAYKAQIEAEKTKVDMNTALVNQYEVQTKVALANVDIYKAELGAIQTRADIEKIKVEAYGEEIKAFVGLINAYTAQVEGYKAGVEAETAKQQAFKSKVDSYTATVQAGVAQIGAKVDEFKARLGAKELEYTSFKAQVEAQSEYARAISAQNSALVDAYKGQVSATSAYNEVLTKQWQAQIEIAARVAEIGVKAAEANAQLLMTARNMAIEAAKVGSQVSAQLGAAALNAVHYSESLSWSSSIAGSMSISESDSKSDNTNRSLSV